MILGIPHLWKPPNSHTLIVAWEPSLVVRLLDVFLNKTSAKTLKTPAVALLALGDSWSDHDDDDLGRRTITHPKLDDHRITTTTFKWSGWKRLQHRRHVALSFAALSNSGLFKHIRINNWSIFPSSLTLTRKYSQNSIIRWQTINKNIEETAPTRIWSAKFTNQQISTSWLSPTAIW